MQKSKLGLPVGVVAAGLYLIGLFGGYFPALLLAGYILLREEDNFLRRAVVKTFLVMFVCSILNAIVYLLPEYIGIFQNLLAIFNVHFSINVLNYICRACSQCVNLMESLLLLILAILAFFGKSVDLKFISKCVDK